MTSKVKADPHVGISAGIEPLCPVRRGRYRRLGCASVHPVNVGRLRSRAIAGQGG
jgi:hypothetical protein